jgi:hypothetical protein
MKTYLVTILLFVSAIASAQEDRYTSAMQQNLLKMDSARTAEGYLKIANSFERIADAEKDKWIPYYQSAFCLLLSSFNDSSNQNKDSYLDKADILLGKAESLKPNNSEIITLKGFSALARMVVNPMERYAKYGALSNSLFDKAKELDPNNPRPDYLIGNMTLNTPEQFGGGAKAALPILKTAMEKYNKFQPETPLSPNWGKNQVEEILRRIEPADSTGNMK